MEIFVNSWEWWNDPAGRWAASMIIRAMRDCGKKDWAYSNGRICFNGDCYTKDELSVEARGWLLGKQCARLIELLGWPLTADELIHQIDIGAINWADLKVL